MTCNNIILNVRIIHLLFYAIHDAIYRQFNVLFFYLYFYITE